MHKTTDKILNDLGYQLLETEMYFSIARRAYVNDENYVIELRYHQGELGGVGKYERDTEKRLLLRVSELRTLKALWEQ